MALSNKSSFPQYLLRLNTRAPEKHEETINNIVVNRFIQDAQPQYLYRTLDSSLATTPKNIVIFDSEQRLPEILLPQIQTTRLNNELYDEKKFQKKAITPTLICSINTLHWLQHHIYLPMQCFSSANDLSLLLIEAVTTSNHSNISVRMRKGLNGALKNRGNFSDKFLAEKIKNVQNDLSEFQDLNTRNLAGLFEKLALEARCAYYEEVLRGI